MKLEGKKNGLARSDCLRLVGVRLVMWELGPRSCVQSLLCICLFYYI